MIARTATSAARPRPPGPHPPALSFTPAPPERRHNPPTALRPPPGKRCGAGGRLTGSEPPGWRALRRVDPLSARIRREAGVRREITGMRGERVARSRGSRLRRPDRNRRLPASLAASVHRRRLSPSDGKTRRGAPRDRPQAMRRGAGRLNKGRAASGGGGLLGECCSLSEQDSPGSAGPAGARRKVPAQRAESVDRGRSAARARGAGPHLPRCRGSPAPAARPRPRQAPEHTTAQSPRAYSPASSAHSSAAAPA